MSPAPVVQCSGAPRDLGFDQGHTARSDVRRAVARVHPGGAFRRILYEWAPSPEEARVRRDLMRHFPHMGERALGVARGAGVGPASLAALLAPTLDANDGLAVAASPERTGAGALLLRTLRVPVGPSPVWIRHSHPDVDHRSIEVVLPWRVPALIGVNEHGLAATATSMPAHPMSIDRCAAPAMLLVQDVLQRFDAMEPALEWCQRRPAGGVASIVLADAHGRTASVIVEGRDRGVIAPSDGLRTGIGPESGVEALEKACVTRSPLDAEALGAAGLDALRGNGLALVADASERSLAVVRAGVEPEWHHLAPEEEAPAALEGAVGGLA